MASVIEIYVNGYQHSKQGWWVKVHIFVANFLGYTATENY